MVNPKPLALRCNVILSSPFCSLPAAAASFKESVLCSSFDWVAAFGWTTFVNFWKSVPRRPCGLATIVHSPSLCVRTNGSLSDWSKWVVSPTAASSPSCSTWAESRAFVAGCNRLGLVRRKRVTTGASIARLDWYKRRRRRWQEASWSSVAEASVCDRCRYGPLASKLL